MRKFAIAAVAVLAIAGSTAVYAQRRHWGFGHMRMNPEDRAAYADARIAAVHAGLKRVPADSEVVVVPDEDIVLVQIREEQLPAEAVVVADARAGNREPIDGVKQDGIPDIVRARETFPRQPRLPTQPSVPMNLMLGLPGLQSQTTLASRPASASASRSRGTERTSAPSMREAIA